MKYLLNSLTVLLSISLIFSACSKDDDDDPTPSTSSSCDGSSSVFSIDLDHTNCNVNIQNSLGTSSSYTESVNGNRRTITVNNVASHLVGTFPNSGNPNAIAAISETYEMTTNPSIAASSTDGSGYTTGILFSGVVIEPYTGEFFSGTNGPNRSWNITALQNTSDLGLDCNNAHVQPTGRYHYHGTPSAYLNELGTADGTEMVKVGYAADGYPIYYKYGFADDGTTIVEYTSGYQLKTSDRGGDGTSAPDGCPDGYYFQDYEYVSGGELDECNGRTGKTPESNSEYYYLITDNFPSMPLCFTSTPDMSFRH